MKYTHFLACFCCFFFAFFASKAQTPSITISSTRVCSGETVRLTATGCPKTVVWSNGKTGTSIVDTAHVNTTYTATCMDGTTPLFTFPTAPTVTVLPKPATPYLFCTKDIIRPGQSTRIKTLGCDGTVHWSNGDTGTEIKVSPTTTTTYTATCVNAAGCSSEPISRTIIVTTDQPTSPPQVSWRYVCQGEKALLKANGCSGEYVWYRNTTLLGSAKVEEIGRGNEVEVTDGGNDIYYTARCQLADCLGEESNRLQIGYLIKIDVPTVTRDLFLTTTTPTVDLNSALAPPMSSGGIFEFRSTADVTAALLPNPTAVSATGTYYVIEKSREGKCRSDVAAIKVLRGSAAATVPEVVNAATDIASNKTASLSENDEFIKQLSGSGGAFASTEPNDSMSELGIPGGLSPNGDGLNDTFFIKYLGNQKAHLRVYNRFGHLVYTAENYNNAWDGTPNTGSLKGNPAGIPDGTYYYVLQLEDGRQRISFLSIVR